ncbi:MAG: SH3 domain-containing protein [Ardenticatenaceae bacterium]|nr:SH3 domain-containing protein [Anaerolineales bacterium]MCB8938568.1 SH3 domain-containing protein [Ardenticatenaceae bacterium]MCB8973701.1 SH3 domain-containing protein [Ardenticatenaceae bacterium]
MEEERPSEDSTSETEQQSSRQGLLVGGVLLVVLLVIAAMFLPPFSLGERLGLGGGDETATQESPTAAPTEAETAVASNPSILGEVDVIVSDTSAVVNVSSLNESEAAAAFGTFPANSTVRGNVYKVEHNATTLSGKVAINVPAGTAVEMVDLYGWNGGSWAFIPSQIDVETRQIVSPEHNLYQAFALIEPGEPETVAVGAELLPLQVLADPAVASLTELSAGTLTLVGTGDLQGEVTELPAGPFAALVRITNVGVVVDEASLAALLSDSTVQTNQINALVNTAVSGSYAGINLDYQGVAEQQKDAFTSFVSSLADALHAQNLTLAVTLATPQDNNGQWTSGGQDWAAIGQVADIVYAEMPLDPTAYNDNGTSMQLLNWATRLVDRSKLTMLVSAGAVDRVGDAFLGMSNEQALANFGTLAFVSGSEEVEPSTAVELALSGDASPLEWDGTSLTYRYSYTANDQTHDVWLGNPAALSSRFSLVERYRLRGTAVRGLGATTDEVGYATALAALSGMSAPPETSGAAIVWTVLAEDGSVLASESGSELTFAWVGAETPGNYTINAEFALGEAVASLGSVNVAVVAPVVEEPESGTAVIAPAETSGSLDPGDADAVVNANANVRVGPGLTYGLIAGGLNRGAQVNVVGRNSDASWLQILMPADGREGWIFSTLLDLSPDLDVSSLEVVTVDPPTVAGGGGTTTGGTTPPPAPPPVANASFELGGQTHGFANPTLMSYAGMNWVKFQHKWGSGDSPDAVAGRIQQAHANGFKVLLSIPGADHSSIDYNAYVNFLSGVAKLGPDAIEIWNEMNIDREWPNGQIDPVAYTNNMLKPAYQAIKAANPNVMVISGAPAPTGFFGGCSGGGCDDGLYISGMANAGAASYMDCIGIHYNEGIIPPSQQSGDPRSEHYTRYFWGMVNTYYNAFGGSRKLCFTELGYLSGQDYGGLPAGFAWAGNTTIAQHAAWLAEATSLAANSGKTRLLIVFNVDFVTFNSDPQAGFAMIRKDGSCPACETLRQVMKP